MDLSDLRREYRFGSLRIENTNEDPFKQFKSWFYEAKESVKGDVNAMTVSTVNKHHQPSSRIVLLKELRSEGFVFFTNYTSQKGQDLEANSQISALFYWDALERQIHIQGMVEKISDADSDAYFYSRPKESQAAAIASNQSCVIDRDDLEKNYKSLLEKDELVRPKHWGGYVIVPNWIEFWQGGAFRLHDRICYTRDSGEKGDWEKLRLAP